MVLRLPAMVGWVGMAGPAGVTRFGRASAVMIRRRRMGVRLSAMGGMGRAGPAGVTRCGRASAVVIRRRRMVLRLPAMVGRVGMAGPAGVTRCGSSAPLSWMTGSRRGGRVIRPDPWRAIGSQVGIRIQVRLQ